MVLGYLLLLELPEVVILGYRMVPFFTLWLDGTQPDAGGERRRPAPPERVLHQEVGCGGWLGVCRVRVCVYVCMYIIVSITTIISQEESRFVTRVTLTLQQSDCLVFAHQIKSSNRVSVVYLTGAWLTCFLVSPCGGGTTSRWWVVGRTRRRCCCRPPGRSPPRRRASPRCPRAAGPPSPTGE